MSSKYVDALKGHLSRVAVEYVIKELLFKYAFLAYPGINTLVRLTVESVIQIVIQKTELGMFFLYTKIETESQLAEIKLAMKKQSEDPNEENEKNLIDKFNKFIKLRIN